MQHQVSSTSSIRSLFGYVIQGHRSRTLAIVGLSVLSSAMMLAQPLLVQQLLTNITAPGSTATLIGVMLLTLVTVAAVATAANRYLIAAQSEDIASRLRNDVIDVVLRLPISKLAEQRSGDLMSRVTSDATLVKGAVSSGLFNIFGQAALLVGAIIGMFLTDPILLGVVVVSMSIVIVASAFASRGIRQLSSKSQANLGRLSIKLKSTLEALRAVRAANATEQERSQLAAHIENTRRSGLALARRTSIIQPLMNVFAQVAIVLVITVGAVRINAGALSAEGLVTFALFLVLTVTPLGDLAAVLVNLQSAAGAFQRITDVLSWEIEERDSIQGADTRRQELPIALSNVSFRYPDAREIALRDVSMTMSPGATTAIVGPSGAGKSTIFNLLLRFYEPSSGSIRIDGASIGDGPRSQVRSHISYVPQDGGIVDGSIRDNLLIGNPELNDTAALALMHKLGLDSISGFADSGLSLDVGEQGAKLSGGERQRLSLARALLRGTPIILLDEPTSSLDGANEGRFAQILDELDGTRTVVVIAHRLSTVQHAERIYVLDEGRAVAAGTHEELLVDSQLYRSLMGKVRNGVDAPLDALL